jgi:alpha-beta hydrolase superfamily lysophospholipase
VPTNDHSTRRRVIRAFAWFFSAALLATSAFVLFAAFRARSHPDLGPWHRIEYAHELHADALRGLDWDDYVANEAVLFGERDAALAAQPVPGRYRYQSGSRLGSPPGTHDWNRSYASMPAGDPVGGVLLLHGLSDSPYSVRHLADHYASRGFVVLAPRLPGHGTTPSALRQVRWRDWRAVVALSMRELAARTGSGRPLHVVGYSNGAALALDLALDRAGDAAAMPVPDRLILLSPMVGIDRKARLSTLLPLLGGFAYFEKSLWFDVQPEFNPFKYNSFPVAAVRQSWGLTTTVQARLAEARASGTIAALPPILAFQSVLDDTVSTPDVVRVLFGHLPANGSELVLFDINRHHLLAPLFTAEADAMLASLQPARPHAFRLTTIVNRDAGTGAVVERRRGPGADAPPDRPLTQAWPDSVYSLSHVALPFPLDDPLYGLQPRPDEDFGIRLGTLELRGERGALSVGAEQLARIGANPFHAYLLARIDEAIESDLRAARGDDPR